MSRGFRHEALLYEGEEGFLEAIVPFLREGVDRDEPTLVAVSAERIGRLREALGDDADAVDFVDMGALGVNPARIIPAWRDFAARHAGSGCALRGVGEPIWPGRAGDELVECHRHEALLNVAFAEAPDFRLVCPYDTTALAPEVVERALHTHPLVDEGGGPRPSDRYDGLDAIAQPFAEPLPEPPVPPLAVLEFDRQTLSEVRRAVEAQARAAGLAAERAADLVIAANEIATNSVLHGGGSGRLRLWREPAAMVVEVADQGHVPDPLAGRAKPGADTVGGYGLWVVNQVCELVQLRTSQAGTVIRAHMRVPRAA